MSNFDFLKDFDETLYKLGNRIEKEVKISPSAVKADATPFLQYILEKLLNRIGLKFNSRKDFYSQLDAVYRKGVIDYNYKNKIYSAYLLRNKIHDNFDEMEKNELAVALSIHEKLFNIAKKYYRDFNENYNEFTSIPSYKPIELDNEDDEIELVKIPDFSEIIDFKYDYCVICGEPNHSSCSLCCPKCSRILDNANNFISIRNYFGKDATFTKEDLIEYGIHEGYANQLINHLSIENMIKVAGRFYTFNNMYFDKYMTKIENYLAVGELITKFREDKITPKEIKETFEYKEGKLHHEPFYEFYKIINHEIINKFESDILTTQDLWDSIKYTRITQKQLETWYLKNLGHYKRGNVNESFVVFNNLLMADYIDLKREGLLEKEIKSQLNVSQRVYDFWIETHDSFEDEITQIKKDLLLKSFAEGKTKEEAIEIAGVTPHEFENLYKVSDYYHDDYAKEINKEMEARKVRFVSYLESMSLKRACKFSKITVNEFYDFYENARLNSSFYLDSTRILMDKYLDERKKGNSREESVKIIGIKEEYVNQWFSRSLDICKEFNDRNVKVTVDLILRGFKWNKSKEEIAEMAEVEINTINRYLYLGEKGSSMFKPLFDYYESEIIINKLKIFLGHVKNKPIRKALESSNLSEKELEKYYELGKSGNEKYEEFYNQFFKIKRSKYLFNRGNDKSHKIAMKESGFTNQEYEDNEEDLNNSLRLIKFIIVSNEIKDGKTSSVAAKKANVSVDEIYEWYFKGRDGEEDYVKFYEIFHKAYVRPAINAIQEGLDNNQAHLDFMIKTNKEHFTKKDVEIWVREALVDNKVLVTLNKSKKEDKKDDNENKIDPNEMLREMGVEDYDKISIRKTSNSSSILSKNEVDVEKLKKEILKK